MVKAVEIGAGFLIGLVVGLSFYRPTSTTCDTNPNRNTLRDEIPVDVINYSQNRNQESNNPSIGERRTEHDDEITANDNYQEIMGKKREAFCLAQAIEAPKWGSPKDLKRTPAEIEAAMKRVFDRNVLQFLAAGGDDEFQHNHEYLNKNSVVVEIGGNKGIFCQELLKRYTLGQLHVIEPVTPMVKNLANVFADEKSVSIHQFALAKEAGTLRMTYRSDSDAAAKILGPNDPVPWKGATVESVPVKTFTMAWDFMNVEKVDLMNINIEGIEFELVQALLDSGMQKNIRNLQIQWHVHAGIVVENKAEKRCAMQRILSKTHYMVYNFDWVWEQWTLKP